MSVLREATIEGLRHAHSKRRLLVLADPEAIAAARARGALVIDARDVASAVHSANAASSAAHIARRTSLVGHNLSKWKTERRPRQRRLTHGG